MLYRTSNLVSPVVLYGRKTWSLTLSEEHRLRVFENRVLRRIFGPKRDEVIGGWRKLHNEELHNVTRLVTVDGYWIDNWIYYNRTLKYNTTGSLRTPSVLQLTAHSAVTVSTATAPLASVANTILVAAELQVPFLFPWIPTPSLFPWIPIQLHSTH
jgi:hypothetical protein